MTAFNGTTLSYDLNGNLTGDGTNTYGWDARNHLASISGGTAASFVYDAFGRRMSKDINGSITQFEYDGLNPVQELDGANPANVTANLLTGLKIDEYFARADSNGAMNFLSDALGSTLALTDSSGAINTSYTYEPFGNTNVSGSNPNPYQFTGRENDGTGMYFYRARYYSPSFQRFVAQDPIGFVGGINLYAYVGNNPISLRDLLGMCADSPSPSPTPFNWQAFNDCLANHAGYGTLVADTFGCTVGGVLCIYAPNPYICGGAVLSCVVMAGEVAQCLQEGASGK